MLSDCTKKFLYKNTKKSPKTSILYKTTSTNHHHPPKFPQSPSQFHPEYRTEARPSHTSSQKPYTVSYNTNNSPNPSLQTSSNTLHIQKQTHPTH